MIDLSGLNLISIGAGADVETILPITLYGDNRSPEVVDWHKRVMVDYLGIPMNYVKVPFPHVSHGWGMNEVLFRTLDSPARPTYYLFLDNDAIFMKRGVLELVHQIMFNKVTLFGHAWNSQHKVKPRGGNHPYASQATMCFSSHLYDLCGRPDMDHHNPRSDTAEELTYEVEERGYILSLIYPSTYAMGGSPLSQTAEYGMSNIYGQNLMYHCSRADLPEHVEAFTLMCKAVIEGRFESR